MSFFSNEIVLIFFQLVFALILGMIMGLQRVLSHKTAGMRTYALVSMGSALFIIVSEIVGRHSNGLVFSPVAMASSVITGIGFLCAGLIIFHEDKIVGLTTAAGLWVAAGAGIAVGFKLYGIALIATLLTLFIFTLLWDIEEKIKKFTEKSGVPIQNE